MIAASVTRLRAGLAALPARNLWAAVAILLNLLTSSAMPSKAAPHALPSAAKVADTAPLPGIRGACEPGAPCVVDRMQDPARPFSIRPPSRTRSWRYRAVFG
jgi:hypothetical protein